MLNSSVLFPKRFRLCNGFKLKANFGTRNYVLGIGSKPHGICNFSNEDIWDQCTGCLWSLDVQFFNRNKHVLALNFRWLGDMLLWQPSLISCDDYGKIIPQVYWIEGLPSISSTIDKLGYCLEHFCSFMALILSILECLIVTVVRSNNLLHLKVPKQ